MSQGCAYQDAIFLAFATPVSIPQLAARLLAYADTKSKITTLHFCLRKYQIPAEIVNLIAVEVREIEFIDNRIKGWVKLWKCVSYTCTGRCHFTHKEMDDGHVWDYQDSELQHYFNDIWRERHHGRLARALHRLDDMNGTSDVAKAAKVFLEDFGIRPYFLTSKVYYSCDPDIISQDAAEYDSLEVSAFLTLPLMHAPVNSFSGPRFTSFEVKSRVDASSLTGPSESQITKFRAAMRRLNLRPFDPKEKDEFFVKWDTDDPEDDGYWFPGDGEKDLEAGGENSDALAEKSKDSVSQVEWPQLMMLGGGELQAF